MMLSPVTHCSRSMPACLEKKLPVATVTEACEVIWCNDAVPTVQVREALDSFVRELEKGFVGRRPGHGQAVFRHGANRRRNTTNDGAGPHDRWNDFVSELEALDYDIVFCTETWHEERRKHCLTPSGHHIYLSGGDGHRGVGICISPSFFKRMKHIHVHAYSSRVSCLHFEIVDTKFVAIVCYMPTR